MHQQVREQMQEHVPKHSADRETEQNPLESAPSLSGALRNERENQSRDRADEPRRDRSVSPRMFHVQGKRRQGRLNTDVCPTALPPALLYTVVVLLSNRSSVRVLRPAAFCTLFVAFFFFCFFIEF